MSYEIENSDTPIFDQLARERDYGRLIHRLPIDLRPAWTGSSKHVGGFMAPGAYIDEWKSVTVRQTDETVDAAPKDETEEDMIVFQKPTTLAEWRRDRFPEE